MTVDLRDDDEAIDPSVHCDECSAVCCRLLVIVEPHDPVAREPRLVNHEGLAAMARGADGWCAALNRQSMSCSNYAARPGACHRFTMGGGHCRAVREDYRRYAGRIIAHVLVDTA